MCSVVSNCPGSCFLQGKREVLSRSIVLHIVPYYTSVSKAINVLIALASLAALKCFVNVRGLSLTGT